MTIGENIYYDIQYAGIKRIEEKSEKILRDLYPFLGKISFPSNLKSINKIYALLENGYYPWMEKILEKYNYDYSAELQYLMMNIGYCDMESRYDQIRNFVTKFPSIDGIYRGGDEYQLDTKWGTIILTPLTRLAKDSRIKTFALKKNTNTMCHIASQVFIQTYPTYTAVTSLVPNQFGEHHYHSYIETSDGYADFSNNIYLSKESFDKVMTPQVLNRVNGYTLREQLKALTEDDLPKNKALLLRLAVHNQLNKKM